MIVIFNQDGTFSLTCDNLNSIKSFIETTNLPYIETNEKLDFTKYNYSLVNRKLTKTEITEVPTLE